VNVETLRFLRGTGLPVLSEPTLVSPEDDLAAQTSPTNISPPNAFNRNSRASETIKIGLKANNRLFTFLGLIKPDTGVLDLASNII
jgi:hypothetical protein